MEFCEKIWFRKYLKKCTFRVDWLILVCLQFQSRNLFWKEHWKLFLNYISSPRDESFEYFFSKCVYKLFGSFNAHVFTVFLFFFFVSLTLVFSCHLIFAFSSFDHEARVHSTCCTHGSYKYNYEAYTGFTILPRVSLSAPRIFNKFPFRFFRLLFSLITFD